jgi:hypothetical protein
MRSARLLFAVLANTDTSGSRTNIFASRCKNWHLSMQPRKRDLPWGAVMPRRHRFDYLDNLQILQQMQE